MKISNVRLGLACNSSSSHSIIILDNCQNYIETSTPGSYGWDNFTLLEAQSKERYLGICLRDALLNELPTNIVRCILDKWLDVEVDVSIDGAWSDEDHIDHQSVLSLPCAFGTKIVDEEFFKELKEQILKKNVAIIGGNDNDEWGHPLLGREKLNLPLPREDRRHYVCRKDSVYGYWSLFWPEKGTKIRFSFDDSVPVRASAPELIDIKINDYCPYGCAFCYQDSTVNKGHADINWYSLASNLAKHKVFEVALGGGEPTLHPRFLEILLNFKKFGVVANFTTKNMTWLNDANMRKDILENCGCFAYSASTSKDAEKLITVLKYHGIPLSKASIQIVMGTVPSWDFTNFVELCSDKKIRLTLLGFKTNGRGKTVKPLNYSWWLEEVSGKYLDLSIDTALASEYKSEILKSKVPVTLFHTEEGTFSMYYDAMNHKIGPSSYCDQSQMRDSKLDEHHFDLNAAFACLQDTYA